MNKIIKKLKTIFETFTILTFGWDFEYGIFLSILETYYSNEKSTNIDNCMITKALFKICINNKRINYSFFFIKLKTYYYERNMVV